jgi:hypothetical protein
MFKYNLTEGQGGRLIVVSADDLQRYALHDEHDQPLQFKRLAIRCTCKRQPEPHTHDGQAVAIATGPVKVYRKPSPAEYHKEYMLHNRRCLWLGADANFGYLARDMYEFQQVI